HPRRNKQSFQPAWELRFSTNVPPQGFTCRKRTVRLHGNAILRVRPSPYCWHFLERRFAMKQQLIANRKHSKNYAIFLPIRNCQQGKSYQRDISSNEESNINAAY